MYSSKKYKVNREHWSFFETEILVNFILLLGTKYS